MNLKNILLLSASIAMLASCSKTSPTGTPPDTTTTTHNPPPDTALATAVWAQSQIDVTRFNLGDSVAKITNQDASGASGIGASRAYPGMFWIEQDQGGSNNIYLFDTTGTERANFTVTGATDRDWTDMSVGPGPDSGITYIYLADIGDSKADHAYSIVYRFPEPQTPLGTAVLNGATATADQIRFVYPSGGPRDAETILLDPQSKDIYIIDKEENGNMYELPYPQSTSTAPDTAIWVLANMRLGQSRSGAIGTNRRDIFIKSYNEVFYWPLNPGESILSAMLATPLIEPYNIAEIQGEAMCLTPDDSEYWTVSKFASPINYAYLDRYKRK